MELMQREIPTDIMSLELGVSKERVESYFRNYYINRTLPIRDLTYNEMNLVKYYKTTRFMSKQEVIEMLGKFNTKYEEYEKDMWILAKFLSHISELEYHIAKKYAPILIEPFLNYDNYRAPRLEPLSKEEIAMLLTNIAVGISVLPADTITSRTSMEAMDRLLTLYETTPRIGIASEEEEKADAKLKLLSPKQLERLLHSVTTEVEIEQPPIIKPATKKGSSLKKQKVKNTKGVKIKDE